jgi:hypothetical protein
MLRNTIAGAAALATAVGALAAPLGAQAHDYRRAYYEDRCTDRIHDNGVTGLLLGGAAGAVLGSNLAGHGARTGGALLGAAAGAAVGSNIARSSTKDRCRGPREVVYYREAPPPPPVYVAPQPVYVAPPPPPPPYGYEVYEAPHDRGLHRGWYKHHHDEDDDD